MNEGGTGFLLSELGNIPAAFAVERVRLARVKAELVSHIHMLILRYILLKMRRRRKKSIRTSWWVV